MVAGMWWFFTLIMISSYTANLAAFLTGNITHKRFIKKFIQNFITLIYKKHSMLLKGEVQKSHYKLSITLGF